MGVVKKFKVPTMWDGNTSKILEDMFNELFEQTQSKYFEIVSAKPLNTAGKNGEIKVDKENNKLYVKYGDTWHEVSLT